MLAIVVPNHKELDRIEPEALVTSPAASFALVAFVASITTMAVDITFTAMASLATKRLNLGEHSTYLDSVHTPFTILLLTFLLSFLKFEFNNFYN